MAASTKSKKAHQDILEAAKKRFELAVEAERETRQEAREDIDFRIGHHWPDAIRRDREEDGKPCLTINRIPQFIRQVTNDQRQNRPAIKVSPIDDRADTDTADVFQGIIRHIEYNSNADVAYDTAFDSAASTGLGYFRVVTDYVSPDSFDQEILIKRIKNRFSVYVDPNFQEPDGSDMQWAQVFEYLQKDDFKELYPDAEMSSMSDWDQLADTAPEWVKTDSVRVAEYYYKEYESVEIMQIIGQDGNPMSIEAEELPKDYPAEMILNRRKSQKCVVKWVKHNGVEILDETEWAGKWIPIIPVLGDEIDVDGVRRLEGVIRHAKDSQRQLNYFVSSETETIALAPRAPWIGAAGSFDGYENEWAMANKRNVPYLQYNPVTEAGQPLAPPQRNVFEAPVQAITNARMQASEDLKATTGIYDASLGSRSNETSGIAIQRRNVQAQTNNFHYVDNLARSLRHLGRILVDLIPKVIDTPRILRIIGEDNEERIVKVYEQFVENGQPKRYDLGVGKYDVAVDTGPSYATKRQEAVDSMMSFLQAYPNAAPIIGDLFAKNMDWPGAQEIADRLKKTLPPELQDQPDGGEPLPPQVQGQLQQMNQMIEMLTQQVNAAQEDAQLERLKYEDKELDRQSKERIALAKNEVDIGKVLAQMGAEDARFILQSELARINQAQAQPTQSLTPASLGQSLGQEPGAPMDQQGFEPQQQPIGGFSPSTAIEE